MKGYIAVTEESLDRVVELTGRSRWYFEKELADADEFNQTYVIFEKDDKLVQAKIDNMYHIPFVMKQKFGLEPM